LSLIEKSGENIRLSELAIEIVAHAPGSKEHVAALQKAALNPQLFAKVYQTHRDASDDALRAHLLTKEGFSEAAAKSFILAFRDTIAVAKLGDTEYNPPSDTDEAEDAESEEEGKGGNGFQDRLVFKPKPPKPGMNQDTYTIPGTQAAVVLQWPDLITTDDLEDIELWLDMMKRKLKRAVQKKEAEEAR
jgi:hypothetical protein